MFSPITVPCLRLKNPLPENKGLDVARQLYNLPLCVATVQWACRFLWPRDSLLQKSLRSQLQDFIQAFKEALMFAAPRHQLVLANHLALRSIDSKIRALISMDLFPIKAVILHTLKGTQDSLNLRETYFHVTMYSIGLLALRNGALKCCSEEKDAGCHSKHLNYTLGCSH